MSFNSLNGINNIFRVSYPGTDHLELVNVTRGFSELLPGCFIQTAQCGLFWPHLDVSGCHPLKTCLIWWNQVHTVMVSWAEREGNGIDLYGPITLVQSPVFPGGAGNTQLKAPEGFIQHTVVKISSCLSGNRTQALLWVAVLRAAHIIIITLFKYFKNNHSWHRVLDIT